MDAAEGLSEPVPPPVGLSFLKYFVHGFTFSLLFLVLSIVWAVLLVFLAVCGAYIGIAIGFLLLFVIVGFLNSGITRWLWFSVEGGFWIYFFHGLVFFLAALPAELAFFAIGYVANPSLDIPLRIVVFLVSCPVYGVIGKWVAGHWKQSDREPTHWTESPEEVAEDTLLR